MLPTHETGYIKIPTGGTSPTALHCVSITEVARISCLSAVVVWRDGGVERRAVGLVEPVDVAAALHDQPRHLQRREEVVLTVLEEILEQKLPFCRGEEGLDQEKN